MIYGPPFFLTGTLAALVIFFALVMGGPEQQQCSTLDPLTLTLPDSLTSHLENPQAYQDANCVIYAATRPNSGVGGLVWKQYPDGHTEIVYGYDPANFYALGELVIWQDGKLRYITVEKDDHSKLVVHLVPGWVPW